MVQIGGCAKNLWVSWRRMGEEDFASCHLSVSNEMVLLFFAVVASLVLFGQNAILYNHQRFNNDYRLQFTNKSVANRLEVFLGDRIVLDCSHRSAQHARIEWFRNEHPLNKDTVKMSVIRRDHTGMKLFIEGVDVTTQGLWSCRVNNNIAEIRRNFTIEVIDFCDYFIIMPNVPSDNYPMECLCLWSMSQEIVPKHIDLSAANGDVCLKYHSRLVQKARAPFKKQPCLDESCLNGKDEHKQWSEERQMNLQREKSRPKMENVTFVTLQSDDSPTHAIISIDNGKQTEYVDADDIEEVENSISPDIELVELNKTIEEPPFFKIRDDHVTHNNENIKIPAGGTLRFGCRAYGNPEPKILWYKDGVRLEKGKARSSGFSYKFNKWSLEVEDAIKIDAGQYSCEVINIHGRASKTFDVDIVERWRTPPMIIPNVLMSQSVNVNDTALFECKIQSDVMPYILWIRLHKKDNSYSYFNETLGQPLFNYTEMEDSSTVRIVNKGDFSSLELKNVQLEDQGLYACISANSIGWAMANASLTVNDFETVNLLTGNEPNKESSEATTVLLILLLFILLFLLFSLIVAYLIYRTKLHKKHLMDDTVGLVTKKRVVVNKKPITDDDNGDVPPYQIQIIEQQITPKEARQRQRKRINSENTVLSEYEVHSDPHWEIDRNRLQLVHMLGEGAFGEVWKASLDDIDDPNEENQQQVAVKKLKISAHEKELIDLVSEMETFKIIGEHENVLRLIGCCTGVGPLYVVLELCRHGNLRDFLRAHRPKEEKVTKKSSQDLTDYLEPRKLSDREEIDIIPHLTQRHLVEFAWQVAKGMEFMANKKIIHRDLAARNVLVADNHVLKISDFGLSRDVHCNDYYRKRGNGRLPIKWMALEALDSHVYTIESDVWSFGILLWEIMTLGGTPYPTIAMPELYATLKEGYRMEAPHNCPEEVYSIMLACWQEKRESRPTFATVVHYLDWMLAQSTIAQNENGSIEPVFNNNLTSSGPTSPVAEFPKKKKLRPLSAPVNLPSEPQHSICDDDVLPILEDRDQDDDEEYHFYCNDGVLKNNTLTEPLLGRVNEETRSQQLSGYVRPDGLTRVVSSVANQSLDSAIGSPAWQHPDDHQQASNNNLDAANSNASFLGPNHQYYNIPREIQYTYFTFDPFEYEMSRSRDSAIFEDTFNSKNYLYSNIFINKKRKNNNFNNPNYININNSNMPPPYPIDYDDNKETIV